jgi:hypothetical protein
MMHVTLLPMARMLHPFALSIYASCGQAITTDTRHGGESSSSQINAISSRWHSQTVTCHRAIERAETAEMFA